MHARLPGTAYDWAWWESVHALYDEGFPGLPQAIATASAVGASWQAASTPFVVMEQGRAVAHAGVIAHPMRLAGATIVIAGIHAVCTTAERRRQGMARLVLAEALAWVDERFSIAKLHTDLPEVYQPHGFRTVPTHRFRTQGRSATRERTRLLQPQSNRDDAELLSSLLKTRTPVSNRCASIDEGWMVTIVASLSGVIESGFLFLEEHNAIVAFGEEGGSTLVLDVIADRLPPLSAVLGAAPDPILPVVWTFSPDLFCDDAEKIPAPASVGAFMVRGEWPLDEPFGISPLWEH